MYQTAFSLLLVSIFFSCSAQSDESSNTEQLVTRSTPQDSINLELDSIDIDFQFPGHCYASNSKKYDVAPNGDAYYSNLTKKIDDSFSNDGHYLFLNTAEYEGTRDSIASHRLYLVNASKSKVEYRAQDSRLYIVAQAKDENGEWKDISYLPSSWCGNSYHNVTLGKDEYWSFRVPVFKGTFATKLRYVLTKKDENLLISNEIDVRLNPGQFDPEKKQAHISRGIMDPYND